MLFIYLLTSQNTFCNTIWTFKSTPKSFLGGGGGGANAFNN
jgi:hypothetical protein